jgi:tetratricopeptide (TPR) repeat protein
MRIVKIFSFILFVLMSFWGISQKLSPKQMANRTNTYSTIKKKNDSLIVASNQFEKANSLFELGSLNVTLKKYKEAISNFSESLEFALIDEVYLERALAYDAIGESKNAIDDINKHLQITEGSSISKNQYRLIYFVKAYNYIKLENFESALNEYNTYIKVNDSDGLMLRERGACLYRLGRKVEAIQDFTKAINLPLDDAYNIDAKIFAYTMRALAKEDLGDYYGALKDVDFALELGDKSNMPFIIRGNIMLKQKSYNSAIANFNIALEKDDKNTDVLLKRAQAKLLNGEKKSACIDLSHLGELGVKEAYDLINKFCN